MLGIEDVLSETLQGLRVRELVFAAKFRRQIVWRNMISKCTARDMKVIN